MRLILGAIVIAVVIGYAARGTLKNFSGARIRWPLLALVGLAFQLWPVSANSSTLGFTLLMVSFVLLFAFGLMNIRNPGFPLIVLGLSLNALVIGVNHGMPVQRQALVRSGQGATLTVLEEHGGAKHHLAGPGDELMFLGDVIPVPKPFAQVVSPGDIATYAGVMWFVIASMRPSRPSPRGVSAEPGPTGDGVTEGEEPGDRDADPAGDSLESEQSA
jgi:hypothetical protein